MDAELATQLVSGGGTLALATIVWMELRAMRRQIGKVLDHLVRLDERTRNGQLGVGRFQNQTPAQGVMVVGREA